MCCVSVAPELHFVASSIYTRLKFSSPLPTTLQCSTFMACCTASSLNSEDGSTICEHWPMAASGPSDRPVSSPVSRILSVAVNFKLQTSINKKQKSAKSSLN